MEVAIALGLILAELSPDPWHGRMITFSQKPQWFTVPNSTVLLRPRVTAVRGMPWGYVLTKRAVLVVHLR